MRSRGGSAGNFETPNPDPGVPLYYDLGEGVDGSVNIDIFDDAGKLIRSYSSEESDFERCLKHNEDPRRPYEAKYPSANPGLNRWNWDARGTGFTCVRDMTLFAGLKGPTVPPGEYTARISVNGVTREAGFRLDPDPRVTATPAEIGEWTARLDETSALLETVLDSLGRLRETRDQVQALLARYPDNDGLQDSGRDAIEAIRDWDHQIIQPLHQTYEDEDAWETMLAGQVRYLLDVIDFSGAPVTRGMLTRLADLKSRWATLEAQLGGIYTNHVDPLNQWATDNRVPHISRN